MPMAAVADSGRDAPAPTAVHPASEEQPADEFTAAEARFLATASADLATSPTYGYNSRIKEIRRKEFARLGGQAYLDYGGAALYSETQLHASFKELAGQVFCNPHSTSGDSSGASTDAEAALRCLTLEMCNASGRDYTVILTSGATAALKMVADCFPWTPQSWMVHTLSIHNSVLGMREAALSAGASVQAVELSTGASGSLTGSWPAFMACGSPLHRRPSPAARLHTPVTGSNNQPAGLVRLTPGARTTGVTANEVATAASSSGTHHLFAAPLECNFSGVRLDQWLLQHVASHGVTVIPPAAQAEAVPVVAAAASTGLGSGCTDASPAAPMEAPVATSRRSHPPAADPPASIVPPPGRWLTLLDAAKACSTAPPDLSTYPADFVAISYYKIFGHPTGLGALLVRNSTALPLLRPTYFAGGTVQAALADEDFHHRRPGAAGFEFGTLPFTSIPAACHGFAFISRLGGFRAIHAHAMALANHLAAELGCLRHSNGMPVAVLYGWRPVGDNDALHGNARNSNSSPNSGNMSSKCCNCRRVDEQSTAAGSTTICTCQQHTPSNVEGITSSLSSSTRYNVLASPLPCHDLTRGDNGPTVTFNLKRADGRWVGHSEVGRLAALHGIHLRTGCFCNPGACVRYLGLTGADVRRSFAAGHVCWDDSDLDAQGRPNGAVRASLGAANSFDDVYSLLQLVRVSFCEHAVGAQRLAPVALPTARPTAQQEVLHLSTVGSGRAKRTMLTQASMPAAVGGDLAAIGSAAMPCQRHQLAGYHLHVTNPPITPTSAEQVSAAAAAAIACGVDVKHAQEASPSQILGSTCRVNAWGRADLLCSSTGGGGVNDVPAGCQPCQAPVPAMPAAAQPPRPSEAQPGATAAGKGLLDMELAEPAAAQQMPRPRGSLTHIFLYPIKSCAAQAVQAWPVGPNGLLLDREWAIVDDAGCVLTQKRCPRLATLQPQVDLTTGTLTITAPATHGAQAGIAAVLPPLVIRWRGTGTSMAAGAACAAMGGESIDPGKQAATLDGREYGTMSVPTSVMQWNVLLPLTESRGASVTSKQQVRQQRWPEGQGWQQQEQQEVVICGNAVCVRAAGTCESHAVPLADVDSATHVTAWFKAALGMPYQLVRQSDGARVVQRPTARAATPAAAVAGPPGTPARPTAGVGAPSVGFANDGQYLLLSQTSLDDLALRVAAVAAARQAKGVGQAPLVAAAEFERCSTSTTPGAASTTFGCSSTSAAMCQDRTADGVSAVARFRPNLVVAGFGAYEEDSWLCVRVGELHCDALGGCPRCEMVQINQQTGERGHPDVLLALAQYRRRQGRMHFGVLLARRTDGADGSPGTACILRVGDHVCPTT